MSFSLAQLIERRQAGQYDLHTQYISPHMARVQQIIGFDKIYVRGKGLIIGDEEVELIVNAFDQVMAETMNLKDRVWATSSELIKQAMTA
jgi:hypothetical protein